jgi:hypothetical protein
MAREEGTTVTSGTKSLQLGFQPWLPLSEQERHILNKQLRGSASKKEVGEIFYIRDIYEPPDVFKPWAVDRYVCFLLHVSKAD